MFFGNFSYKYSDYAAITFLFIDSFLAISKVLCIGVALNLNNMQNKQKVTLYIPSEIHKRLKIRAATDEESMSFIVEKAVDFYLQHPPKVEESENINSGKIYQVHFCPECKAAISIKDKQILPLKNQSNVIKDNFSLDTADEKTVKSNTSDKKTFVFY